MGQLAGSVGGAWQQQQQPPMASQPGSWQAGGWGSQQQQPQPQPPAGRGVPLLKFTRR
jgi:hypothetical protein